MVFILGNAQVLMMKSSLTEKFNATSGCQQELPAETQKYNGIILDLRNCSLVHEDQVILPEVELNFTRLQTTSNKDTLEKWHRVLKEIITRTNHEYEDDLF
jgi:hypothetical protein